MDVIEIRSDLGEKGEVSTTLFQLLLLELEPFFFDSCNQINDEPPSFRTETFLDLAFPIFLFMH
jgi:hypothetical protein